MKVSKKKKKIKLVFHPPNSYHCLFHCFTFHSSPSVSQPDPLLSLPPPLSVPLSPPCHPSISLSLSISLSDMGRVGYPDKARLYKHSSTTGRTPSPERGISPQSSHTNAYIHHMLMYMHTQFRHTQSSNITPVTIFFFSMFTVFIQP